MAQKFPRRQPKGSSAMNLDYQEGFRSFAEELTRLDEHNFGAGGLARASLDADVMLTYNHEYEAVDPVTAVDTLPPEQTNRRVKAAEQWVTIPTGASTVWSKTVTCTTICDLEVTASFQVFVMDAGTGVLSLGGSGTPRYGFAIAIDGVLIPSGGAAFNDPSDSSDPSFGSGAECVPVVVEAEVPVDPGDHVVEVKCLVTDQYSGASATYKEIFNRELIIRERRS